MTVQSHHAHLRRIASGLHAWDVAVGVKRQLQRARLVALDVVGHDLNLRVHLSWHRIFVRVFAGIVAKLLTLRCQALEELHRVLLHLTLVEAHPHQLLRVGCERHGRIIGELLLVHPVRDTIDDLVALTVLRHLALGVVVEQLDEIDVIVAHKGNDIAIGREHGCLLRASFAQRFQLVVLDGEDIIGGGERAAVDTLRLRLDKQSFAVGAHDVAVHPAHLLATSRRCVKEHAHLLTRLERIGHDAPAVVTDLCVGVTASQRRYSLHRLLTELITGDVT